MAGILVQIAGGDVVMLSADHAAKPREVAFDIVGVGAIEEAVALRVVDTRGSEGSFQRVPMGGFVGKNHGARESNAAGNVDAFMFSMSYQSEGSAGALPKGDNDAALTSLVASKTTVNSVVLAVLGADVAAEIGAVDLYFAREGMARGFAGDGFAELVGEDEGGLVLASEIT